MKTCLQHHLVILTTISLLLLSFYSSLNAQTPDSVTSVSVIGGVGNYEYLYSGFNFPFSKNHYFEVALGIKPWKLQSEFYAMTYVDVGLPLFDTEHPPLIKVFLQPKIFVWYFNNEWNRFLFTGLGGELRIAYPINQRLNLCSSAGVVYNLQLYYERKTYEEVGYPKELQPSFSLQLSYQLK